MSPNSGTNSEIRFEIKGMHCAGCVSRVEQALRSVPGVDSADVQLMTREAIVRTGDSDCDPHLLARAIQNAGYEATLIDRERSTGILDESLDRENRQMRHRFFFAAILTLPVMIIDMAHLRFWGADLLQLFVTTLLLATSGREFFIKGIPALLRGWADMNSLIALGTGSAYLASLAATLVPAVWTGIGQHPHLYYEAACTIFTFVLLGRWLEHRARGAASQAIRKLVGLQEKFARVRRNGDFVNLPLDKVATDDLIQIRPGERIPVDGLVVEGESSVDESMLTGEPIPVFKSIGQPVTSGTMNRGGSLVFRATRVGNETVLQKIVQMVRQAQGTKSPIARLADRISRFFVPGVLVVACLTFLIWSVIAPDGESFSWGLTAAIGVLIVACPCALGLAVPTAMMVAGGRGAELGILIRNGETYQKAERVDRILIDKTGTITQGRPVVVAIHSTRDTTELDLLRSSAAVESLSEHPLADAVVQAAQERRLVLPEVNHFRSYVGRGVSGDVEGKNFLIGSPDLFSSRNVPFGKLQALLESELRSGRTPLLVAVEGQVRGLLALEDTLKPSVSTQIRELVELGISVEMLTGDQPQVAGKIAHEVGISEYRAAVTPAGKLERVQELQQQGFHVAMVGDGINDAPALAEADVGIAMAHGADIAIESGDITILGNDLSQLVLTIKLARTTMRTIRRNLFLAFLYNTLCIPLAAGLFYPSFGIWLTPMWASAAMAASSLSVVLSSLRLRRFGPLHAISDGFPPSGPKPPAQTPPALIQISLTAPPSRPI